MRRLDLIVAAVLTACLAAPAAAQTGRAAGTVVDDAGKAIAGATIQAVNAEAYPPQLTSTTDNNGRFAMIGLRLGVWRFAAEAPGYESKEGTVPVRSGSLTPLRFVLTRLPEPIPGALSKDIESQLSRAQAMREGGRYDQALTEYRSIQAKNPKLTSLNLMIADIYRQQASQESNVETRQALYDQAKTAYGELLKTAVDHDRATIELGLTEQAAGNLDAAARTLQSVIDAGPDRPAAAEAAAHLQKLKALNR